MHEQLAGLAAASQPLRPLSECTSMELHTPHSTEVSCTDTGGVFNFSSTGVELEKEGAEAACRSVGDMDREFESVSEVCRADLESASNLDGLESRGSASPKSYTSHTSHSSLEDRPQLSHRMQPIPEAVKAAWPAEPAAIDSEEEVEDSSNLVPPDMLLKRKQVVFSESLSPGQARNNAVSPITLADILKESKTSNVNMSVEGEATDGDRESLEMNNKINFDSEKYRHAENTRPAATIDNLGQAGAGACGLAKRSKCTNVEGESKRPRMEEKNVAMEVERREGEEGRREEEEERPGR